MSDNEEKQLFLKEQLCFPMYASSRMMTKLYKSWLDPLNLTYPQYLVMLVLWKKDGLSIGSLCEKLYLNTNTLTPIISTMIDKDFLIKTTDKKDRRSIVISLTNQGKNLKKDASSIPESMAEKLNMPLDDLLIMRTLMWKFLKSFKEE
jgi:MarR family transcriptional regulator, organic hydroperoxide resistance regulator